VSWILELWVDKRISQEGRAEESKDVLEFNKKETRWQAAR
jgi:hypothetical protein